jgi:hypothetical protein
MVLYTHLPPGRQYVLMHIFQRIPASDGQIKARAFARALFRLDLRIATEQVTFVADGDNFCASPANFSACAAAISTNSGALT